MDTTCSFDMFLLQSCGAEKRQLHQQGLRRCASPRPQWTTCLTHNNVPIALDEIAEVMEVEGDVSSVKQVAVQFNQKDDDLHRGSSIFLKSMPLVMYSQFVCRVPRSKAGKVDSVKFFAFDAHYPHHAASVCAGCFG